MPVFTANEKRGVHPGACHSFSTSITQNLEQLDSKIIDSSFALFGDHGEVKILASKANKKSIAQEKRVWSMEVQPRTGTRDTTLTKIAANDHGRCRAAWFDFAGKRPSTDGNGSIILMVLMCTLDVCDATKSWHCYCSFMRTSCSFENSHSIVDATHQYRHRHDVGLPPNPESCQVSEIHSAELTIPSQPRKFAVRIRSRVCSPHASVDESGADFESVETHLPFFLSLQTGFDWRQFTRRTAS
ncbi:hypothetical protein IW261DRAFT_1570508 [Armillaria novae-zelandiae]|uniref:Uncharacterized protein n=1 Tax=Armillaria novae-zelandiae TaxID=153914 RepID=A0AA39NWJ4_9AGAR|nr:hypothetical protein IW261DRAFT_1570508 [Armillaria novae-zelandiae]